MRIPKYIDEALIKRRKTAVKLANCDEIVTDFIIKHNIDVDFEDYCGGAEMYSNPYASEQAVREAILKHNVP